MAMDKIIIAIISAHFLFIWFFGHQLMGLVNNLIIFRG
jgi:hypothetical protein